MSESFTLHHGDCLDLMADIADGSIDMILADLPYGTTACKWDTIIPFEPLWSHYKRIIKRNGAIVLTASQPFTSALVMSNPRWFKYAMVWDKAIGSNHLNVPFQPHKTHEDICVFSGAASTYSPNGTMAYNPQFSEGEPYRRPRAGTNRICRSPIERMESASSDGKRHPVSIIRISNASRRIQQRTQKPVALMEYLIRTYTNEGEIVLDNVMGSGTTGVACLNTGRRFIGMEKDAEIFGLAKRRIEDSVPLLAAG